MKENLLRKVWKSEKRKVKNIRKNIIPRTMSAQEQLTVKNIKSDQLIDFINES